jgi:hypothetical protein
MDRLIIYKMNSIQYCIKVSILTSVFLFGSLFASFISRFSIGSRGSQGFLFSFDLSYTIRQKLLKRIYNLVVLLLNYITVLKLNI